MRDLYLVAYYFQKPQNSRVHTQLAGWQSNKNNVVWDEQVHLATRLRAKDYSTASMILNITKKTIVKNSGDRQKSYEELHEYYQKEYPKYAEALAGKLYPDVAAGAPINT